VLENSAAGHSSIEFEVTGKGLQFISRRFVFTLAAIQQNPSSRATHQALLPGDSGQSALRQMGVLLKWITEFLALASERFVAGP